MDCKICPFLHLIVILFLLVLQVYSLNGTSTIAKMAKQSLKYSYPGLQLLKNLVLYINYKILTKIATFWLRSHRSISQLPLPELLWQRYHAKNYSAFLQNFLWITSNVMKPLSGCQILVAFSWETIEAKVDTHYHNYLPDKDIMLKITQSFFRSSFKLHLTICRLYLGVKIPMPENFLSCVSQVMSIDNYHIW